MVLFGTPWDQNGLSLLLCPYFRFEAVLLQSRVNHFAPVTCVNNRGPSTSEGDQ